MDKEHSVLTDALCAIGALAAERKLTPEKLETVKFHLNRAKKEGGTEREILYVQTAESLLEHDTFGATNLLEEVTDRLRLASHIISSHLTSSRSSNGGQQTYWQLSWLKNYTSIEVMDIISRSPQPLR